MPAVDSLLRMIATRNAEALTLQSGAVPELRRGGAPQPLSMPPLDDALVGAFLAEIGGADTKRYQADDGSTYAVRVERAGAGVKLTFRPANGAAAEPAPAPPAAAPRPAAVFAGELGDILGHADSAGASDVLLSSGANAWLRVGGEMRELPDTRFSDEQILRMLEVDDAALRERGSIDTAVQAGRRYRVNVFLQARGVAAALRPIRDDPPTLDELALPRELHTLTEYRNGLVLVAGMAGAGKSTTLVALIEHLNRTRARHVITLEDPIEYLYHSDRCLIHQRQVGDQVPDFATGLRAALRESPDVILVGEMRDRETVAAAITAAETGHLVLATLHASSAMVAIDRMIDVFPENQQRQIRYQIATTLRATLTQFLLPSPLPPGRAPAFELMRVNDAVSAHIRDDRTHQIPSAIQTGRADGMIPLELSLARQLRSGRISRAVALGIANDADYLRDLERTG